MSNETLDKKIGGGLGTSIAWTADKLKRGGRWMWDIYKEKPVVNAIVNTGLTYIIFDKGGEILADKTGNVNLETVGEVLAPWAAGTYAWIRANDISKHLERGGAFVEGLTKLAIVITAGNLEGTVLANYEGSNEFMQGLQIAYNSADATFQQYVVAPIAKTQPAIQEEYAKLAGATGIALGIAAATGSKVVGWLYNAGSGFMGKISPVRYRRGAPARGG